MTVVELSDVCILARLLAERFGSFEAAAAAAGRGGLEVRRRDIESNVLAIYVGVTPDRPTPGLILGPRIESVRQRFVPLAVAHYYLRHHGLVCYRDGGVTVHSEGSTAGIWSVTERAEAEAFVEAFTRRAALAATPT